MAIPMPSFPHRRESRVLKPYQPLNIPKNKGLDSRLRGNDGIEASYFPSSYLFKQK
ncbi:hypothetical protein NEIMUCOT_03536 [Neisseria mucosa ATCC 25996]|uniref:Uncharacterized protein n=1 Tax=Neisseria mucosa (strain ATCC 25996 / DSM 4631 / NCTC 10774 / M26) TaxID=546266 RepID=D2ZSF4_NEIM2|nr:hypothetical protein NEIMUCOT_03536 [Neisseria mucosa ATCC 25996]